MPLARQVLDKLQSLKDVGEPLSVTRGLRQYHVLDQEFLDAKKMYATFSNFEDYKVRVENSYISIYANDKNWLWNIAGSIKSINIQFYQPNENYVALLGSNTILVEEDIGYSYKVTFGNKKGEPGFGKWAQANPKQIKIGTHCLDECLNAGYINGMYFYARDERTLQLCSLMTSNIRRIDKLIVKQDIDK